MREVAVSVSQRRRALVDLHMPAAPGDVLFGKRAQHDPRSMTAADGHHETLAYGDRCARFPGDEGCRPSGDRVRIGKYFSLHASLRVMAPSDFASHPAER